ncbi:MAG TPA: GntR family transcriptional regulator [Pseudonocardia sp.]|nr:GntR family transcriptional regulator [Pseudonocardia sp.]
MAGSAVVYAIDGLTTVELVCAEIRTDIHAGRLLPGRELRLRDIAESRRVRLGTLSQLLVGLERDGLLVRRGDVAIVAPLDADELTSVFKLRRMVEASLLTRSCELISERELDRLDAVIPSAVGRDSDATFGAAMRELNLSLLRPAASNMDQRVIRHIHQATRRYHCLGIEALRLAEREGEGAVQGPGLLNHLDRCHQLVGLIRARNTPAVRSLVRKMIDDSEVLARRSFDLDHDQSLTTRVIGA